MQCNCRFPLFPIRYDTLIPYGTACADLQGFTTIDSLGARRGWSQTQVAWPRPLRPSFPAAWDSILCWLVDNGLLGSLCTATDTKHRMDSKFPNVQQGANGGDTKLDRTNGCEPEKSSGGCRVGQTCPCAFFIPFAMMINKTSTGLEMVCLMPSTPFISAFLVLVSCGREITRIITASGWCIKAR